MTRKFIHQTQISSALLKPTLLTLILAWVTVSATLAQANPNPGIAPTTKKSYGKTYGQWAAAWQQWAFGIPASQSPFLDETGASAGVGQSGPVWFLTGNFGGTTVRHITVPNDKALFFPVVNSFFIRTESTEPTDVDSIRAILQGFLVGASFSCEIDGRSMVHLPSYYTESPLFKETLYADNLFGLPQGKYGPAMTLGYYLLVDPLAPGTHTIHFVGLLPNGPGEDDDFSLDVTYNITVVTDDEDQN